MNPLQIELTHSLTELSMNEIIFMPYDFVVAFVWDEASFTQTKKLKTGIHFLFCDLFTNRPNTHKKYQKQQKKSFLLLWWNKIEFPCTRWCR